MKNLNQTSDEALMLSFQSGSHEAFEVLFERYKARVYSFIKRRTKNSEDTEEIFQQVFMKLTTSRLSYKQEFAFTPWLFTVCKSTIADFFRKDRSVKENNIEIENLPDESYIATGRDFQVLATELSNTQKSIVEMRVLDELTFEEISYQLKISPTNVRQILSRSLKKLRLAVNAKDGDLE